MDRGLVLKRLFDLAVSLPALVVSLPMHAVAALAVRVSMGRPVLFRQRRPGLHGEVFELVKFRTMHHENASRGRVDDASRLTTTGRVLRKLSIDELPSLWNVVRGDMSLVGPRPLLERYLDRYSPEQARRHEVRPGLTGLAQVSGRNQLSWEGKLRLDVEYVDTRSFVGDLRILAATVRQVVRGSGVSAVGEATMPEFHGTATREDRA
jgi:lipopolysaccharide/colanic/teichoic acid biosynthesis glycosyltransferase